jgi:hypothetical protein
MYLLTIFDHRVFAKEMQMDHMKTSTSPWISSRKIKDLCAIVSLWKLFRIFFYSGKNSNLKLDKCKKNILYYFLFTFVLKVCYLKMDCYNKMKNK